LRLTVIAAALCIATSLTSAQPAEVTDLPAAPGGRVVEVIDGDTVILSNGDEVRMVGIQAPKLPLDRAGFRAWPLADEAKATLEALVRDRSFTQHFGGAHIDRHGRVLAHLVSESGIWLQGEMLRLGMARVYTFPDNIALAQEMLALEDEARRNRFGIWSHPFYAIRSPDDSARDIGTFQIVEGVIREAADVRGDIYLNFGANWRDDFTVAIRRENRNRFGDLSPADRQGAQIRVRGWLKPRNGPMIEATHPEQIELLKGPSR